MERELLVDARYLEPPEPFVLAMEALDTFDRDPEIDHIRLLIFREPFPLYKVLDQHGYRRSMTQDADGTYTILVRRQPANG